MGLSDDADSHALLQALTGWGWGGSLTLGSELTWPLCPEIINYEFDTKDLVCLGLSSVVGVWYLLRKVSQSLRRRGGWADRAGWDTASWSHSHLSSALDCQQPVWPGLLP